MNTVHPTLGSERIIALDFLRGFAILGILLINIQSFAMPGAAYMNPSAYGDLDGINYWIWWFSHLLGDQKFMTIFSILYGAGIIMVTQNAEKKGNKSAGLHYRRTFWLLIIGLLHAHLLWYGDILVPYALCAFLMYLFRKMKPTGLLIIGIIFILVHPLIYNFFGGSMEYWPEEALISARDSWAPGAPTIQEEIGAITGTIGEQLAKNSSSAIFLETMVFLFLFLWRAGGLMLVGMALYKWGVLTAQRSSRFYGFGLLGLVIGIPIILQGIQKNEAAAWSMEYSQFFGSQWNYFGSLFVSFGYICLIMLIAKSGKMVWLQNRLAAVGRMALTNYLTQSIICVFIFYGIGLGLFGQFERWEQLLVVISVWILQIIWSKPWINSYRFGPAEWLWRSLTYRQRQTFKRK